MTASRRLAILMPMPIAALFSHGRSPALAQAHHRHGRRHRQGRARRRHPRRDRHADQRSARHPARGATTNANGDFVFANVPPDTYTIQVTMDGSRR